MSRIFRVVTHGRFDELAPASRAWLADHVLDHDGTFAAFGPEPNLSYTRQLDVFSVRQEVRVPDDTEEAESAAAAVAERDAGEFLRILGIGHRLVGRRVSEMTAPEH